MRILVSYKSGTGFTKQYAEWIGEALSCEVCDFKNVNAAKAAEYDLVIHGGWIMGGMINGLNEIRNMNPQKLVTFGVGFTEDSEYENTLKETNHLGNIPFYYMAGGFHPKKMGFFKRKMVEMVTKQKVTETDLSDKKYIEPLLEYVRSL